MEHRVAFKAARSSRRALVCLVALFSLAAVAPGAAPGLGAPRQADAQQRPSFRVDVGMTRVKAAVIDADGEPVAGLGPADFRVLEDGLEQEVQLVLDPLRFSLDVAMVLDFSNSVRRDWSEAAARRSAHAFLDRLSADDCVFVLPFHQQVGPGIWGVPGDPELRRVIDEYSFDAYTRLYDAVLVAHDALDRRRPDSASAAAEELRDTLYNTWMEPVTDAACGEPLSIAEARERRAALVVLTDGEDLGSRAAYSDVLLASWRSEVPVFAVAVGMAAETAVQRRSSAWASGRSTTIGAPSRRVLAREELENLRTLREQLGELVRVSGGQLVLQQDLGEGYDATMTLLRSYYVLAYTSPKPVQEGWHELEVELVGKPGEVIVQPGLYRSADNYASVVGALRQASVAMALGQFDEALGQFDLAAAGSPDIGAPFFGRGLAMEKLARWDDARNAYERSLRIHPGATATHLRLAEVCFELGDHAAAWEHAIRAQLGGVDMSDLFASLRQHSPAPLQLDERLAGPVVHLTKPRVPRLEAQMALRDLLHEIATTLDASPPIALTSVVAVADFSIGVWVRKLEDNGALTARLVVREHASQRTHNEPLAIDDIADGESVRQAALESLVGAREWILSRHERQ